MVCFIHPNFGEWVAVSAFSRQEHEGFTPSTSHGVCGNPHSGGLHSRTPAMRKTHIGMPNRHRKKATNPTSPATGSDSAGSRSMAAWAIHKGGLAQNEVLIALAPGSGPFASVVERASTTRHGTPLRPAWPWTHKSQRATTTGLYGLQFS